VRMTQPKQDVLVARRVGGMAIGLFARRDYLAERGTPRTPADLQDHALVGFDADTPYLRRARQTFPIWSRDAFALRCDSDLGQLALVRAGCGIGVCQVAVAARDRSLVRVLPRQVQITLDTWVVMHRDLRGSPRCRATFDALVKGLASARGSASTPP